MKSSHHSINTFQQEILKIGVIYVKPGQDDQKDILRNDNASPLYREFVDGLGWPVDLKSHRGYSLFLNSWGRAS